MSDLSRQIANLPPDKLEQLLQRLAQKRQGSPPRAAIPPRDPAHQPLPLSFAQQRLWLLDQMEPGSPLYNLAGVIRLRGPLDKGALEASLNALVARHESLRTTFDMEAGQPVQRVAPALTVPLGWVDLSALGMPEQAAALDETTRAEGEHSFDLRVGPLLRATLVRLATEEHVLLLTMHHIISDGWSLAVVSRELGEFYAAHNQPPAQLAPLPIQYPDYALWQREMLQGEELDKQLRYWRERLAGAPPLLDLPLDFPRPPVQRYHGGREQLRLPAEVIVPLRRLSQQADATLFMTLLAAFVVLMQRLAGQDDVVVGSPIAGRSRRETEGLIGFFLNTLVLRTDLSGTPTFREVVARVRETALGAFAHQELPFEQLLEAVQPERALSHSPLFQLFFNMLNLPAASLSLAGLTVELLPSPDLGAKFDLTLYAQEEGDEVRLELVYNADLFGEARAREMLAQYHTLLEQAVNEPERPVATLSLLTPTSRALLPDPTAPLDGTWHGPIHAAVTRWAAQSPDAIAVQDPTDSWSYRELEARSNQLAHWLIGQGIQPEEVVALYAHRSASLVWALLGVLKAGAAFTMLDPSYPGNRLADYLQIATPRGLLQLEAAGALPAEVAAWVASSQPIQLTLPAHAAAADLLAGQPTHPPAIATSAEALAVLTFTSGSTGKPKGVQGRHGPLTHFYPWMSAHFGLSQADTISMVSGLAHDPLQRDIFTPLWLGARIAIPDPEEIPTPGGLAAWMSRVGVTVTHLTPALGQILTESTPEQVVQVPSLRYAFIVGDVLTRRDVARIRTLAPHITCINLYGSTETQRAVGYYPVPDALTIGEDEARPGSAKEVLALGQGMPDVQLLVLTPSQQLAGIGEVGEIYLRSPHLARGYLGDEGLTAARFLPNPWTRQPGDRLYRTGDLGRYRPDGLAEFVGRADLQVKIRGFRIELGEIEGLLMQHPAVREAVVIVRDDLPATGRHLVAYVVPLAAHHAPAPRELHHFLRASLPDYMVPAAFVLMEQLPLTPNRKVDRRALPRPEGVEGESQGAAPRTATEEVIAAIWEDVLGVTQLGVEDNFFEIGGHSLLATQVMTRLRGAFQVEVPMRHLFETPTVAGLAPAVEAALATRQGVRPAPPMRPVPRDTPHLPLSFAQQRLWFLYQLEPSSPFYNISAVARVYGQLEPSRLEACLSQLAARHESLRTTFDNVAGQGVQIIHPPAAVPLDIHDLRTLPAEARAAEAERLTAAIVQRPFDLVHGPLWRTTLLWLDEGEATLLLTIHHIIADGWTMALLIRELLTLYGAQAAEQPLPIAPPSPLQYADFAHWQRGWLRDEVLQGQIDYWLQHLRGAPPLLALPTDRPRPPVQSFQGAALRMPLPDTLTEALRALCRAEGVTLFMLLLATFEVLMRWFANQDDFVVGTDVAGRTRQEIEGMVGCFVNQLALRATFAGEETFRAHLAGVRQVTLDGYAYQDVPFEKLVEVLNPPRQNYAPLFQVKLALHNLPRPLLELPGLRFEVQEVWRDTAQMELQFNFVEGEEGLAGVLEYNTNLFEARTAATLVALFEGLLGEVTRDPAQPLDALRDYLERTARERAVAEQERFRQTRRERFGAPRRPLSSRESE